MGGAFPSRVLAGGGGGEGEDWLVTGRDFNGLSLTWKPEEEEEEEEEEGGLVGGELLESVSESALLVLPITVFLSLKPCISDIKFPWEFPFAGSLAGCSEVGRFFSFTEVMPARRLSWVPEEEAELVGVVDGGVGGGALRCC